MYPQVASFSGEIWDRRFANWEQKAECLEVLNDTSKCAAVKVVAMHNAVMFVGGDDSIWGMGMRTQGRSNEESQLRKIESPEAMRNFKKVCAGKFTRMILTEDNRLFFNGEARRYMLGSGYDRSRSVPKFDEFPENFYRLEAGDKMIDCCGGKHFCAVAT